jgi:hypothetical protein
VLERVGEVMCVGTRILSAASLAPPYIWTLSHKWHDFIKNLLNIKCAFDFSPQIYLKNFLFKEEFIEILS